MVLSHHDWLGDHLVRFPHRALVLMMRVPTFLMIHSEAFLRRQHLVDGMSFLVEHAGLTRPFLPLLPSPLSRLVMRRHYDLLDFPHHSALIFRRIDQYGM